MEFPHRTAEAALHRSKLARIVRQLPAGARSADPGDEPDRELLERFTAGRDEEAFATLVRRHGRTVLAACRQVLTDPADVDDAFQATFLTLLRRMQSVRRVASLGGWLHAVAHRVAVHARSDARRRADREAEAARRKRPDAPPADVSWREAVAILHEELDRLPDRYRLPLLLCYLGGRSRDEAARNLGRKPGAVKGCLERGRRVLAGRLAKRGITLSVGMLVVVTGSSVVAGGPPSALVELTVRSAVRGSSPAIAALVNGALPMILTWKKTFATLAVLAAVAALGVGFGSMNPTAAGPPRVKPTASPSPPDKNDPGSTTPVAASKPDEAANTVRAPSPKGDEAPTKDALRDDAKIEESRFQAFAAEVLLKLKLLKLDIEKELKVFWIYWRAGNARDANMNRPEGPRQSPMPTALANDDHRRILRRPDIPDAEVEALRQELLAFLNRTLDAYSAGVRTPDGMKTA